MANKKADAGDTGVKIIIEKYLSRRDDIPESIKGVLKTLFKGKTNTIPEWDGIVKSRLERPA